MRTHTVVSLFRLAGLPPAGRSVGRSVFLFLLLVFFPSGLNPPTGHFKGHSHPRSKTKLFETNSRSAHAAHNALEQLLGLETCTFTRTNRNPLRRNGTAKRRFPLIRNRATRLARQKPGKQRRGSFGNLRTTRKGNEGRGGRLLPLLLQPEGGWSAGWDRTRWLVARQPDFLSLSLSLSLSLTRLPPFRFVLSLSGSPFLSLVLRLGSVPVLVSRSL